ncbi:hypothetical protein D3C87_2005260 [compost metagenome]
MGEGLSPCAITVAGAIAPIPKTSKAAATKAALLLVFFSFLSCASKPFLASCSLFIAVILVKTAIKVMGKVKTDMVSNT